MRSRKVRNTFLTAVLAVVGLLLAGTPAYAYPATNIFGCDSLCWAYTSATVTWYNRTAGVIGYAWDTPDNNTGVVTDVVFEAYAGSTKIDSELVKASENPNDGVLNPTYMNFTIGDPNRVGGFDRLKVTVCWNNGAVRYNCAYKNNYRP